MQVTKKAVWSLLSGDATLMGMLEQAPYMGRLPDGAKISRAKGAISMEGETSVRMGDKEDQALTLHVWTEKHDLAETIYERLITLMHSTQPRQWRQLTLTSGKAMIRLESAFDLPDATSELFHKVTRWRVRYARA